MIKRLALEKLVDWKQQEKRKPLIVLGARQVGKSYLLEHFGKEHYKHVVVCNFEKNLALHSFFENSLEPDDIVKSLSLYLRVDITKPDTLLIFDEVQECPRALTSLKYFAEDAPDVHLACAGSLLGVALQAESSFPVGKVTFLPLYPLTFQEFLCALGEEGLSKHIKEHDCSLPLVGPIHEKLLKFVKQYLIIGGMPSAVLAFIHGDILYSEVRAVQRELVVAYQHDFTKHAGKLQSVAINALWQAIPVQLSKELKRFYFSKVDVKSPAQLKAPLQWLIDAGLALLCSQLKSIQLPLSAYAHTTLSKLYLHDVGVLTALLDIDPVILLAVENPLFTNYKGALIENFVAQELKAEFHKALYYWISEGNAEVDFVCQSSDGELLAVEVKAGLNPKAKSLTVFLEKYQKSQGIRVSSLNFRKDGRIHNYPLYAVCRLPL